MGLSTTNSLAPAGNQPGLSTQDPWVENPKAGAVNKLMDELMSRFRHNRSLFEREWFMEILFYAGHHWVIFDRQRGQWRMKRGPRWFPRPVTNRIAEHVDDNVSALTRTPPELSWLPTDDDPKSIAAADVADRIDEVIVEETGRFRNARVKAGWTVLTGSCFVESGYDKGWEHGTVTINHEECRDCGYVGGPRDFRDAGDACPQCQGTNIGKAFERTGLQCPGCGEKTPYEGYESFAHQPCPICADAAQAQAMAPPEIEPLDPALQSSAQAGVAGALPTGGPMGSGVMPPVSSPMAPPAPIPTLKPIYSEVPIGTVEPKGKLWERVRSPFEVFYDLRTVREFNRDGGLRECIIVELVDAAEVRAQYPGLPLLSQSSAESQGSSLAMQYLESVSMLAGVLDPVSATLTPGPRGGSEGPRMVRETIYQLPTPEYPEGLTAIRLNGSIVAEVKDLAFHDADKRPFIPVVHIPFKKQPGRVPGRTFTTDIIPLNRTRNESEAMMMLCERRMANPVWVVPEGIVNREPSGEPGEVVTYKHMSAGQGRPGVPQRVPGIEPSLYFERRLEGLDGQCERLSGSFAIAHGEAPKGITAASALALLGERQERAVSPQVQAWEQAHEELARQQMYIFKEYATESRTKAIQDSMSKWSFESWSNADLGGNITVKVEPGSATPKSNAQMRATVEAELRIPGLVNIQDPDAIRAIHQTFGTTRLIQHQDVDTKDAQQENDLFLRIWRREKGGKHFRFRQLIDNHPVHVSEHRKMALGDEFRELEEKAAAGDSLAMALVQEFYDHLLEHIQAMAPPPMPAGPDGEGQHGGQEGRPEGSGSVFSAGRKDVPGTERPIIEPGSGQGAGLR